MSTESNKAVARRFIEEVLGKGNLALMDEITVPGYSDHSLPSGVTARQAIAGLRAGFPDMHFTVDDLIAEGDKVATRSTAIGTHTGTWFGIPPTGKVVTLSGFSIYRIADGKLVEAWVQYDQLGMMQQLGVIPSMG
jgi:predicted ester cyclase